MFLISSWLLVPSLWLFLLISTLRFLFDSNSFVLFKYCWFSLLAHGQGRRQWGYSLVPQSPSSYEFLLMNSAIYASPLSIMYFPLFSITVCTQLISFLLVSMRNPQLTPLSPLANIQSWFSEHEVWMVACILLKLISSSVHFLSLIHIYSKYFSFQKLEQIN